MSIQLGAMTHDDMVLFEKALLLLGNKPLRYLEIGCWNGNTVVGVHSWCEQRGIKTQITTIDVRNNLTVDLPVGTNYVLGDSLFTPTRIIGAYDLVFIDGCHCLLHCANDIINYAPMVVGGGYILIHDTSPHLQGGQPQGWVHPQRHPFHLGVLDAIEAIKFPWNGWKFVDESNNVESNIGGMRLYSRL